MWRPDIKTSELAIGLFASAVGVLTFERLTNFSREANAAKKLEEAEEQGAQKAERILLGSTYYKDLETLSNELEGEIILPTDRERYHVCRRRAFNLNQRGFPCVIARVRSTQDVATCIKFVNQHREDITLCVASGCHSSKCMMDFTFVIDFVLMTKVELDEENLTAKAEGGAYVGDIDKLLQPHNLAVPMGTYPQTGIGGLTLGGGFGFLSRKHGFTTDNFVEAEVVLANGEIVVANDKENSDLIWGLRGGSGNFGVVTKFTLQAYKLPSHCLSGRVENLTPTLASAIEVAANADKLITTLPDNVAAYLVFRGGSSVTETLWAHFGEEKTIAEVPILQKVAKLGGWLTVKNTIQDRSFHSDLQKITTPFIESGHMYHTLIQFGELGKEMSTVFWEGILPHIRKSLHRALVSANFTTFAMGGSIAKNDPDGSRTCLTKSIRRARYFALVEAVWKPEYGDEGKEAAREWARTVTEIIQPYRNEALRYAAADTTVGTADLIERDEAGYGMDRYPKLRILKKKYDPTNLFKNNMNIDPAE